MSVYATQLLEKDNSGCHALLRDDKVLGDYIVFGIDLLILIENWAIISVSNHFIYFCLIMPKVEDLSRMFRLFFKIPKGLDPVSSIFKQVSSLQLMIYPMSSIKKGSYAWHIFLLSLIKAFFSAVL